MKDLRGIVLWWAVKRRVKIDKPFIIAITGSIAKTSTKVAIGAVLRRAFPGQVRVGYGNLNSFLGVPLAILNFKVDFYSRRWNRTTSTAHSAVYKQKITWQWIWILKLAIWRGLFGRLPQYLVLEYGADHPGDIEELGKMLPLDAAIITLTGAAHLANYSSLDQVANEKAKILDAVSKNGWGLVNKNDPYLKVYKSKAHPLTEVETETEDIAINFARAVGQKLGIEDKTIGEALVTFTRPEGRMQLKDLGGAHLLDDSYNANPLSMKAAFNVLAKLPGRKVAIL
ncbi:MAG: Mur ligase family protein, partial [Candidatus Berkelbacteria bacterium]|nr:Mur ligase family protein [Candidatus Berkelbacteria bacterium]